MRELEARFPEHLVVVGVHSAKYPAEREDAHLAAAIERLELGHPVVNDGAFVVWQSYAVRAWPTLMFIDPEGKVIGKSEGEVTADMLAPLIEKMIDEFGAAGLLSGRAVHASVPEPPQTTLAFPGDVAVDQSGNLYVADTNHHRIVEARPDGQIVRTFGSGVAGFADGAVDVASFRAPQGIACDGQKLIISDTGNHAIRRIDLDAESVVTIAGTGELPASYVSGGDALETGLRSPWGIAISEGVLYVAMAGSHQLWAHRLGDDQIRRMVGTGHEDLRDGTLAASQLAQPSGIAVAPDGRSLLFTDSETSAVRRSDIPGYRDGLVHTLVGEGLFEFGDVDGLAAAARLQHPLGVAVDPATGVVYVADTYNNKIKRIDPTTGDCTTWLGDGVAGSQDGVRQAARFFEPAGLSIADGTLFIADTNNHVIRRARLDDGLVETVEIRERS
ncbi:MAG: alkyl hydroperoxide reductase [Thermomicrobiales bacterium]|nr:alkyl hydroperoxide reductase [Thermomicrobiales bacterium]